MNSIVSSLEKNPESLGAEIFLLLGGRSKDGRLLVVVEGKDDTNVYGKLYDEHKYKIWYSSLFPGCGHFVETANELNENHSSKFIMVKDADFDHLDGTSYDIPNLFLTDTHDIETMMFTDEFCNAIDSRTWGIRNAESICQEAMREIMHLSYLKWMSRVEGRKIKFSDSSCRVGHKYDGTAAPGISDWLDRLKVSKQPDDALIPSAEEVRLFEENHPVCADSILQLTNGHDMELAIMIKIKSIYHGKILKSELKDLLQSSYTKEIYMKSKLYGAVAKWEENNNYGI